MTIASLKRWRAQAALSLLGLAGILALAGAQAPEATAQEEAKKVLIYSGTTGYRHEGGG